MTAANNANKANASTLEVNRTNRKTVFLSHRRESGDIQNTFHTSKYLFFQHFYSVLPLDLLSPSALCESVMLGWAGFAADGNDGIG